MDNKIIANMRAIKKLLCNVNREGIENLKKFLDESDFFTAPASTKYHLAEEGGLCQHTINVYKRLRKAFELRAQETSGTNDLDVQLKESLIIVAVGHDLGKVNYYKKAERNVKNKETGLWETVPYYTIEDNFPLGHGEKAVILLQQLGIILTNDEILALRWHMGAFDDAVQGGYRHLSEVYTKSELAYFLHQADEEATFIDEK